MGADRRTLGVVEAAFRADEQSGRAGVSRERLGRRLAAPLVGEQQRPIFGPVGEQGFQFRRLGQLRQLPLCPW